MFYDVLVQVIAALLVIWITGGLCPCPWLM
jgi:hypothetical protein